MTCLSLTGVAFDPHTKINKSVAKVIGFLVFGKCFDNSSTDFQTLLDLNAESLSLVRTPLAQVSSNLFFCYMHRINVGLYQTLSKKCSIFQVSRLSWTDHETLVLFLVRSVNICHANIPGLLK